MTEKELKQDVDKIIEMGKSDDETAHAWEDELHLKIIMETEFCPLWVKREIKRLCLAEFARWCA